MQSSCMRLISRIKKKTNLQEYRKYNVTEEPIHIADFAVQKFVNLLRQQRANTSFLYVPFIRMHLTMYSNKNMFSLKN